MQVNIGSNAFAKITHLYVKEGDKVKRGQMLAVLDNVQPAADVSANDSALNAARTDAVAARAAVNTAAADLNSAEAEYEHAKLDYDRNKSLYDAQLIAKSDYDTKKAALDTALRSWEWTRLNSRRRRPNWILPRAISAKTPPCSAMLTMC